MCASSSVPMSVKMPFAFLIRHGVPLVEIAHGRTQLAVWAAKLRDNNFGGLRIQFLIFTGNCNRLSYDHISPQLLPRPRIVDPRPVSAAGIHLAGGQRTECVLITRRRPCQTPYAFRCSI